ncbi:type-F conjugative transfer system protein TraW [Hydrogenophilus thermoluteolus]|uniref:type-F conjugative transfer system protein TraW n=1 Tax=Hydrogenophilus thermoluteolus TaxID=297 RepID=UPI0024A1CC25|nr:type-F conjugative transfer system protein TraW [Hydrogenophilus thermoluteolus]GLW61553.1 type-F conjugative transfer system protein TraW [Hydrogenophilus thermoluteolus]
MLRKIATFSLALCCCAYAHAEDLGVIGPTYEITERDLIEVIKEKFARMEKTGELARMEEEYKRRVIEGIERPRPVPGIRPTEVARTFYIDPTYTLERNVVDEHGRIIYPAGTKINPFDYDRMSKVLLFFDGRDEKQVAFAKRFMTESTMPVKPILVAGEPLKLMREWKQAVFYDQGGALSRRFSITQSPAIVSQEGKMIRVDEIRP